MVVGRPLRALRALLFFAPAGLMGCAGASLAGPGGSESTTAHPLLGAPAPEFELTDLDGHEQSLAAHQGKVVIVDFWATWCKPCKQSFPAYQQLVDQAGGGLTVLAASQDDSDDGLRAFRSETGVRFPIVWDEGRALAKSYDPPTMPTAFVVDRSGIVRFVHVGYRAGDEQTLEQEVRSLAQ